MRNTKTLQSLNRNSQLTLGMITEKTAFLSLLLTPKGELCELTWQENTLARHGLAPQTTLHACVPYEFSYAALLWSELLDPCAALGWNLS